MIKRGFKLRISNFLAAVFFGFHGFFQLSLESAAAQQSAPIIHQFGTTETVSERRAGPSATKRLQCPPGHAGRAHNCPTPGLAKPNRKLNEADATTLALAKLLPARKVKPTPNESAAATAPDAAALALEADRRMTTIASQVTCTEKMDGCYSACKSEGAEVDLCNNICTTDVLCTAPLRLTYGQFLDLQIEMLAARP